MKRCFSVDDLLDPLTRLQLLAWAKILGMSGLTRKRKEEIKNHVREAFQKSIQWQLYGCPDEALRRIGSAESRPLLAGDARSEAERLLNARVERYREAADVTVDTDGKRVPDVVEEIVSALDQEVEA